MKIDGRGHVLITGGAGFIGTNLARRLASEGESVLILDSLAREGVESNLRWLLKEFPDRIRVIIGDIRDPRAVREAVGRANSVFHFASQVAVTTSVVDPLTDFDVNARGTLQLLETIRSLSERPPVVYTSTNKVLGRLERLRLVERQTRYEPVDSVIRHHGIGEDWGIEFCSPYGCSKGAADQYVLDYAHTYGMANVVFRMSCIYGPFQYGNEDQGWVAHFLKRAIAGKAVTFYGDGKQVRDLLFVEDLVEALLIARSQAHCLGGKAFHMGGGPQNAISLAELVGRIEELNGAPVEVIREDWRPSDQRYYVSDTRHFAGETGWSARTGTDEGLRRLYEWLRHESLAVEPSQSAAGELRSLDMPSRSDRRLKLLMTTDTVGGVWTYTLELLRGLRQELDAQVVLATLGGPMSEDQQRQVRDLPGVEVHESRFRLEWMQDPWEDVERSSEWLLELERAWSPDVIHLNQYAYGALAWRAPAVVVGHSDVYSWYEAVRGHEAPAEWERYRQAVREGLRRADLVIAPSGSVLEDLRRWYAEIPEARVIRNGRDPAGFGQGHKEEFIVCVGRLWDEAKNIAALDRIAAEVVWPVIAVGDLSSPGGQPVGFSSLRATGPLTARQLAETLARASIFVSPAKYEPFGLSVLEAALSGCALVLSDIPSLRENWDNAAVFVDPDDQTSLREVLRLLIDSDTIRAKLGAKARERAMGFDIRSMARAYSEAYAAAGWRREVA